MCSIKQLSVQDSGAHKEEGESDNTKPSLFGPSSTLTLTLGTPILIGVHTGQTKKPLCPQEIYFLVVVFFFFFLVGGMGSKEDV